MCLQTLGLAFWIISFGLPVAAEEAGKDAVAMALKSSSPSAIALARDGDGSGLTVTLPGAGSLHLE